MKKYKILIDVERMKYRHTGLFHFCYNLSENLLKKNSGSGDFLLSFFLPKNLKNKKLFSYSTLYVYHSFINDFSLKFINNYDLYHSMFQGSRFFPFRSKNKIVLTIHDLNFLYENKPPEKQLKYLQKLQKKVDRADAIVAISNFVKNDVEQHLKLNGKSVEVIYNGCNINENIIPKSPDNMPSGDFLFAIGTLDEKKNFHVLPNLLVGNNYNLVIAGVSYGSDAYPLKIIQTAETLGVAGRVFFIGGVDETEKYWLYQHCKAFVHPSLAEGFGLPVVEAMYFEKPIFLSTATSLPEIGGKDVFYFKDFSLSIMQATFQEGMQFFEKNSTTLKAALKQRASKFQWEKAAQQYLDLYQRVLKYP